MLTCTVAPSATASSGCTVCRGAIPIRTSIAFCTHGILVAPPIIRTSSTGLPSGNAMILASPLAFLSAFTLDSATCTLENTQLGFIYCKICRQPSELTLFSWPVGPFGLRSHAVSLAGSKVVWDQSLVQVQPGILRLGVVLEAFLCHLGDQFHP